MKELEVTSLSLGELEAVRLTDLEGLNQEDAALCMGISRRALWEDLHNARRKIVDALVSGKAIEIKGGNYALESGWRYTCHECKSEWEEPVGEDDPSKCPSCGSDEIRKQRKRQDGKGCGSTHRCQHQTGEERGTESAKHDEE